MTAASVEARQGNRPSLPWRAARWCYWRVLETYRRAFQHRNHVFRFDPSSPPPREVPGLTVERIDDPSGLSDPLRAELVRAFGEKAVATDVRELRKHAVYWIGRFNGEVAAARCTREGCYFRAWMVPINPHDIVIFRGRTVQEYRGCGIAPSMLNYIARLAADHNQVAYVDCRVYNKPSIRSIEKAGFTRIATMRPIRCSEALGYMNSAET